MPASNDPPEPGYETEDACTDLLAHVFADHERLLASVAPDGLDHSPLCELVEDSPAVRQWLDLLGNVAWEVFSMNNDVVSPAGTVYHLGSWRGSGAFVANFLNRHFPQDGRPFGYLDFYMGLMQPHDEALRPLYVYVFERLHQRGCTWRYAPPAIGVLRFDRPDTDDAEDPATYDPGAAVLNEAQQHEQMQAEAAWMEEIRRGNEEAFRQAVADPPVLVQAYRDVYGALPPYVRTA